MSPRPVRVRFAPSPTGPLHIGGLRTAIFNYLFAKKNKGVFILRIEDTDQGRFVPGAEEYIIESLKWAGIVPDEGDSFGGEYGPYKQSNRKERYKAFADQLIASGNAYFAFDTPEELDKRRKECESNKETFIYNSTVREKLNNSLTMSKKDIEDRIASGEPYVIRFKFEPDKEIIMSDLIRGKVTVQSSTLDDKVLYKSDGMPTYHLANVVDDYLMKISHVIRGEEWLPSLPLHWALYEAFKWEKDRPKFAHLPLILKPDGKGKLSKRDGDKGGFPVFPLNWMDHENGEISKGYRESGYFPEACVNILAFLGWNPGKEKEIYSKSELYRSFSFKRIGKSGSKFDPDKAKWYNHQYLQKKSNTELTKLFIEVLKEKIKEIPDTSTIQKIIGLVKERANFVHELWDHADFFFVRPDKYDEEVVKKRWNEQVAGQIKQLETFLAGCDDFNAQVLEPKTKAFIEEKAFNVGQVMSAMRLCLVGASKGPGVFDICEVLGKEEVLVRLRKIFENLKMGKFENLTI